MGDEWTIPKGLSDLAKPEEIGPNFFDRLDRIEDLLKQIASSNSNILKELKKISSYPKKR